MDLKALRYAAMVSTMTGARAVEAHGRYLEARGRDHDPSEFVYSQRAWIEPRSESSIYSALGAGSSSVPDGVPDVGALRLGAASGGATSFKWNT